MYRTSAPSLLFSRSHMASCLLLDTICGLVAGRTLQGVGGPLAARRGGVARQPRALQVRPAALHGDQLSLLRPRGPQALIDLVSVALNF